MYRAYLKLKACPRCGGDLLIDKAIEDDDEVCIQCGYRKFKRVTHDTYSQTGLHETVNLASRKANKKAREGA